MKKPAGAGAEFTSVATPKKGICSPTFLHDAYQRGTPKFN